MALTGALVALLALLPGPAGASGQGLACLPFSLTQTYRGWGPADHYGRDVTIAYVGTQCSSVGGGIAEVDITGTATVFRGLRAGGSAIEARSFEASGTWSKAGVLSAWPLAWWSCGVDRADLRWEVPGVYSFAVSATGGRWVLDVGTGTGAGAVHWEYDACS